MARTNKDKKRKHNSIKNVYLVLVVAMLLVGVGFLAMLAVVDAFPKSMVLSFVAVMLVMIILAGLLFRAKKKGFRIVGIVLATIFLLVYGMGIYYMSSTYAMFARITDVADNGQKADGEIDVTKDSFNIYITGIDQYSSEKGFDLERSDVNMILTICPQTRKILLTSIPRDTYVPLHMSGAMDKLTHTGVYGVDETLNTIHDWLGVKMDYYVKVNFTACVKLVDAMGGIDLYNPQEFKSDLTQHVYPKGNIHLKGKGALFYARERHAFEGKDSIRVENQQRVVKAVIDKLTSSATMLTNYGDILNAVQSGLEIGMPQSDIRALIKMQLAEMSPWEIETQKLEGEYDMDYVASLTQESKFLVYKAKKSSVKSIKENIDRTMNPTQKELTEATVKRQKNSMLGFLRGLLKK